MKEIIVPWDDIAVEKIKQLTKEGTIPSEYTSNFIWDYKTQVQMDGTMLVRLTDSSNCALIQPLLLNTVKTILYYNRIDPRQVKFSTIRQNNDKYSLELRIANDDGTRSLVNLSSDPTTMPFQKLSEIMKWHNGMVYFNNELYSVDIKAKTVEKLQENHIPLSKADKLKSVISTMTENISRIATATELELITEIEKSKERHFPPGRSYASNIVIFAIDGFEQDLQNKEVLKQTLLTDNKNSEFYVRGDYALKYKYFPEDYDRFTYYQGIGGLAVYMEKSMEFVIDLNDEEYKKITVEADGLLSYEACKKQGISCNLYIKKESTREGIENWQALVLGISNIQAHILDVLKEVLCHRNRIVRDGHNPVSGYSWHRTDDLYYSHALGIFEEAIKNVNADEFDKLKFIMSDNTRQLCDEIIRKHNITIPKPQENVNLNAIGFLNESNINRQASSLANLISPMNTTVPPKITVETDPDRIIYKKYKVLLATIYNKLSEHRYVLHGTGIQIGPKKYSPTAGLLVQKLTLIKKLFENTNNEPSEQDIKQNLDKMKQLINEIETDLSNKKSATTGSTFFGLGARDETTAQLYRDILMLVEETKNELDQLKSTNISLK